jgi:hypothetical protein
MSHLLIVDVEHDNLVHTQLHCNRHVGLAELVEEVYGIECIDPAAVEEVAHRHGLFVPVASADHSQPCPHCSAAGDPPWRTAA